MEIRSPLGPFGWWLIKHPAYKKVEMQARRQNDVRTKTAATLARAKASAQAASKVRQMVAESIKSAQNSGDVSTGTAATYGGNAEGRQGAVLTLVLAVSVHYLMLSYVLSYAVLCCPTCYLWYPMLSCAVLYAPWWFVLAFLPPLW